MVPADDGVAVNTVALRLLAAVSPALVALIGPDERILDLGGSLVEPLGVARDEVLASTVEHRLIPDPVRTAIRDALEGRERTSSMLLAGRTWHVATAPWTPEGGERHAIAVLTYADDLPLRATLDSRNRTLAAAVELSSDFIAVADPAGEHVAYVNRAGRELVGLGADEALDRPTMDYFTEAGLAHSQEIEDAVREQGYWQGESELRDFRSEGGIPVSVNSFLVRAEGKDEPLALATVQRDLRGRLKHETALAVGIREQRSVAELGVHALEVPFTEFLQLAIEAVTARSPELAGTVFQCVADGEQLSSIASSAEKHQSFVQSVRRSTPAGRSLLDEAVVTTRDIHGDPEFETTTLTQDFRAVLTCPVPGAAGPWGVLGVAAEATRDWSDNDVAFFSGVAATIGGAVRRHELETQLRHQALHDPLTGLPNRTLALDRIDQALVRSARTGTAVAVIAMDVDDFGSVNDSLGQQAGDELLTELATGLASLVPAGETLARSGGDEFAVVSEGLAHEDDAAVLVETLLSVAANGPGWGRHHVHPTLSAGLTLATETGTTAADLLSRADIALSRAKRDRPGTYRIFDEGMRGEAMGRFNVAGELRHALRTGGLHLAYQPIVSLRTGEVVAVEALARWTTEQGEQVPPDVFVPIAEETGLIGELGLTVLREACRHAVCWQEIAPVGIRVNVSGRELQLATYAHTVAGVLEETGLSPHVLGLEITESVLLSEGGTTQGTVADLHQAGITLLIDDFGTGFSSLSYLQRFPDADVLKIDRSFVGLDPRGEAVVRAVVGLGQAFGLTTCAEGTETAEQLHRMRELGCDYAQGYHLARPMPAAELEALLRAPGRPEGA